VVRAGWSVSLRRLSENVAATLPFQLLLFLPIVVGFGHPLFAHWADPAHVDPNDTVLLGKQGYLNPTFFFVRVAACFLVWIALAWLFRSASLRQDESGDPAISLRLSRLAAPGLLLFALTVTFAAFDWIMSLDPHWFSTIFGINYFAGGFMAFLAFVILLARWLGGRGYLREAITTEHYHDLGKLLFGFMVFWTYTNFSQYMLIWYANLPEETHWFAVRNANGWGAIGVVLIVGHFFVPFAFLMSRHVKRSKVGLAAGAIFLLVIHNVDMQFLVLPGAGEAHASAGEHGAAAGHGFAAQLSGYLHQLSWMDFGCFLGLLALVAGLTLWNVRRHPLLPVRDPRLSESLQFVNL